MMNFSFKSPWVKIVVIVVISTLVGISVALLAFRFNFPEVELVAITAILLGISSIAFGVVILKEKRKVEEINKGKKLVEVIRGGMDVLPRGFVYACVFVICLLGAGIILRAVTGNFHMIPLIAAWVALLVSLFAPRKIEIYERGIKHGLIFVEWKDIEEVKCEKGILLIKTPKIGGSLRIKDEDGKISEIVRKYGGKDER